MVGPAAVGVNVAEYVVPDPERVPIVPPETVISSDPKLVVASLEVKVNEMGESFVVDPVEMG